MSLRMHAKEHVQEDGRVTGGGNWRESRAARERERDRQTDRQTDRQRRRETRRETETERWKETETEKKARKQTDSKHWFTTDSRQSRQTYTYSDVRQALKGESWIAVGSQESCYFCIRGTSPRGPQTATT